MELAHSYIYSLKNELLTFFTLKHYVHVNSMHIINLAFNSILFHLNQN